MEPDRHTTVETELQMLEKLYGLGDYTGAKMIARRLLISHTLSPDEKRRIKNVIDATNTKSDILWVLGFSAIVFVLIYLYFQYIA